MIVLLLQWSFLFLISGSLGGFVLHHAAKELGDGPRFFLAHWLGLFLWGNLLLWFTPFTPLSPLMILLPAGVSLALISHHPLRHRLPPKIDIWLSLPLLAAMLAYGLKIPTTSDAISYQYDIHAWLSNVGTVPGLALIHTRFGFLSSWFTLPALFNHGPLEGRMTASVGAFAAFFTCLQVLWALRRALQGTLPAPHLIATAALALAMFPTIALNLAAGPSHDVPIVILSVLCFWTLLLRNREEMEMLPVLFASLALATKLSSLPLLAVCGLCGLLQARQPFRYACRAAMLVTLLMLPWVLNQVLLTGWPFYPLGISLNLPWSLSQEVREIEIQFVRDYAPWGHGETLGLPARMFKWLREDYTRLISTGYLLMGLVGMLALHRRGNRAGLKATPLFLGIAGVSFWLWTTAHPRFGWGVIAILPTAWLWTRNWSRPLFPRLPPGARDGLAGLAVFLFLALPPHLWTTGTQRLVWEAIHRGDIPAPGSRVWSPPTIPAIHYTDSPPWVVPHQPTIIQYNELPLSHRPMYFPLDLRYELQFRNPERGLRGGVVILATLPEYF